ncbi:MAG: hypothetical protein AABY86_08315 [Bdellovibrionota bacterium]
MSACRSICLEIRRPFIIFLALFSVTSPVCAQLYPYPLEEIPLRKPANLVPDDEMEVVPVRQTLWTEQILVEDDAGVLNNMQNQITEWETRENFVEQWDLESTGLYDAPTESQRQRYIGTNMLRYFDKRLAGEVKNSEDNSALRAVGQLHKTLRPKAEAQISEHVRLRFKAQALQGKAYFILENPYVESQTLVTATGRVELTVAKSMKSLGVATRVNYYANKGEYVGEVDKTLTDHIIARYSSRQNDKTMMFNQQSDQTIQLIFSHPF